MIREFNPDKHSLWHAAEKVLSLDPRVDIAIRTLSEEYGFTLADGLPIEDFQDLVRLDRDGSSRMWSTWRMFEDEELAHETEPLVSTPTRTGPPYEIIYADPPWPYRNKKTGGSFKSGASQHYKELTLEQIQALPIQNLADSRCALFLWGTVPATRECWSVLDAWGFTYKTTLYWIKDEFDDSTGEFSPGRLGMGQWFRGQVEYCLVGIRGKVPAFRCQRRNYIFTKSSAHSRKPVEVRNLALEAAAPVLDGPRIELFSRDSNDEDWDHWGGEHIYNDIRLTRSGKWLRKRDRVTRNRTSDSIAI